MKENMPAPQPVKVLLNLAERSWGARYDDDGKQLWWIDEELYPDGLMITNGTKFFVETEVGILQGDIGPDGVPIVGDVTYRYKRQ